MKKVLSLCLAIIFVFSLASCKDDETTVKVGYLNDASAVGIAAMFLKNSENIGNYKFKESKSADKLVDNIKDGKLDIAILPANYGCIAYNETDGAVKVIDISAYNVLYLVSTDDSIKSADDLIGKNIYITENDDISKLTLEFYLNCNGIKLKDVSLKFQSDANDVTKAVLEDDKAVGLLKQPFVTDATVKNERLKVVTDLGKEFRNMRKSVVSSISIVRKDFLEENPELVENYLIDHSNSATMIDIEISPELAKKVVSLGIIDENSDPMRVIPECEVTSTTGEIMKNDLSSYYEMLYMLDKSTIGDKIPDDNFYYILK